MNGWIKYFADGSMEVGRDEDIVSRHASWTRGRLENMFAVELHHEGHTIVIEGTGQFWQSDDLEAHVGFNHEYNIVTRRIQKKIEGTDHWLLSDVYDKYQRYKICSYESIGDNGFSHRRQLDNLQGKWFTVELDLKTGHVIFDFKENRI